MRTIACVVAACGLAAPTRAQTLLDDDFESYDLGSVLTGQGGWDLWPGGVDAIVDDEQVLSGSQSFLAPEAFTDMIFRMRDGSGMPIATSGQWMLTTHVYMPSDTGLGEFFVILLNTYVDADPGSSNWSMQLRMDSLAGIVESQFDGSILPIILDEWVEVRAEIDLDNDLFDIYYGGELLAEDLVWTENVSGGGALQIDVLDLFSNGAAPVWVDDVTLEAVGGTCRADLDGDGELTIFDFLAFQSAFDAMDPVADFDDDGEFTIFDFLAFQSEFDAGCP